jgi:hypothetical protein
MGKSSKNKNKKLEKRKKRSAQKKKAGIKEKIQNVAIEKRLRDYPNFIYHNYDQDVVSKRFAEEVKQILINIKFDDPTLFTPPQQKIFKLMKQIGFDATMDGIFNDFSDEQINLVHRMSFFYIVGEIVFSKLKEIMNIAEFIPYNIVEINPQGFDFEIKFKGLHWKKSKWGRVYYSSLKPKLTINGKEYIVAFSRHSNERICDRCVGKWKVYAGATDAFAINNRNTKYELVKILKNDEPQYFITFYEMCLKGFSNYYYVTEILDNYDPNKEYYYRVGYCPIGFSDNFVSAITLLTPGMKGTPEFEKMKESNLKSHKKSHFQMLTDEPLKNKDMDDTSIFNVLKWYHQNGIPQVLELEEDPFGYTKEQKKKYI